MVWLAKICLRCDRLAGPYLAFKFHNNMNAMKCTNFTIVFVPYLDKCVSTYLDGHSGYIWMNMFTIKYVYFKIVLIAMLYNLRVENAFKLQYISSSQMFPVIIFDLVLSCTHFVIELNLNFVTKKFPLRFCYCFRAQRKKTGLKQVSFQRSSLFWLF